MKGKPAHAGEIPSSRLVRAAGQPAMRRLIACAAYSMPHSIESPAPPRHRVVRVCGWDVSGADDVTGVPLRDTRQQVHAAGMGDERASSMGDAYRQVASRQIIQRHASVCSACQQFQQR